MNIEQQNTHTCINNLCMFKIDAASRAAHNTYADQKQTYETIIRYSWLDCK